MNKKFIVRLCDAERRVCEEVVKKLKGTSQKVRRAQILLKADADGPAWTDEKISEAVGCWVQTVENLRKRVVMESFESALEGKKRAKPPTAPLLAGGWQSALSGLLAAKADGIENTNSTARSPNWTTAAPVFGACSSHNLCGCESEHDKRTGWPMSPSQDAVTLSDIFGDADFLGDGTRFHA